MMNRYNTRLCASAAIAAALAFGTSPLLAQVAPAPTTVEPAPVLTIPQTPAPASAPVPAPQPTIVIPDIEPAPTTVAPEPENARTPARTATTTRTERAAPRAASAAPVAPAPEAAADVAPEPVAETATQDTPATVASEPVAPTAASEPAAMDDAPRDNDAVMIALAALAAIAALGLAIWGFIAIGRRKPVDRKAATLIERPVVTPRTPAPQPETAAPTVTPLATARPAVPSMSHSGASVALPSRMPATFEERDALIRRMIEAKPDRANPFTSPIQRRKRAKLILQSLGRDFGTAEPWIDLSQYPQNWPELAARRQAA